MDRRFFIKGTLSAAAMLPFVAPASLAHSTKMRQNKDWISAYLDYNENTEPPKLYHEWIAVSCIASSLQRKAWLEWGGELVFYPNFYVVLVGPSGRCRKGTAMSVGRKLLRELGIKVSAEAITREALIRELNDSTDLTTAPGGKIIPHASLTVYSPELTVFLGYNNIQLIMDLTDWYDCADRWTYRTKSMGTDEISGVWLNLIGATTPHLIQSALPRDAIGGGLASRMIFVYEEDKEKIVSFPFLDVKKQQLRSRLLSDLTDIQSIVGGYKVTSEFLDKWDVWYIAQHHKPPFSERSFDGYIQRRPQHVLKLSIIMAASEGDAQIITESHLDRAIGLLERTERKMQRTFAGYGGARHSDVLVALMDFISTKRSTTEAEIITEFYGDLENPRQLTEHLDMLQRQGFCQISFNGSGISQITYIPGNQLEAIFGKRNQAQP